MKNINQFLKIAVLLVFIGSFGAAAAQTATAPEQAAKNFYEWYLRELNKEGGSPVEQKTTISKYVSKRLLREVYAQLDAGEYDADYFINAQDFNEKWQVTTTKSAVKGKTATLKVLLAAPRAKKGDWKQSLSLTMIQENGVWKIDRVS